MTILLTCLIGLNVGAGLVTLKTEEYIPSILNFVVAGFNIGILLTVIK